MAGRMIPTTLSRFTLLTCLGGAQLGLYFVAFPVGIFGRPCRKSKEENGCIGTARRKERACGKVQKTRASTWALWIEAN